MISNTSLANTIFSITSLSVVSYNFYFCNELNKLFKTSPCLNII